MAKWFITYTAIDFYPNTYSQGVNDLELLKILTDSSVTLIEAYRSDDLDHNLADELRIQM